MVLKFAGKFLVPTTLLSLSLLNTANAQSDVASKTQALTVISNAVNSICYNVAQSGEQTNMIVSGTMDRVASLTGSGELRTEHYRGVVQTELVEVMKITQDCKKDVFSSLVVRMIPTITNDTGLPIDRGIYLRPRTTEQPSIDCGRTNEPLEDLICADADLAAWDGRMGQIYHEKMRVRDADEQKVLQQSQRDWIKTRYANCNVPKAGSWGPMDLAPAKPCVLLMTKQRISVLQNY
jgi:uncharacterized protein YecT (DUF1311 family)